MVHGGGGGGGGGGLFLLLSFHLGVILLERAGKNSLEKTPDVTHTGCDWLSPGQDKVI